MRTSLLDVQDLNFELIDRAENLAEQPLVGPVQDPDQAIIDTIRSYSDLNLLLFPPTLGTNSQNYTEDLDEKAFIYSDVDAFGGTNSLWGGAYTNEWEAFGDLLEQDPLLAPSTVVEFDFDGRDVHRLDHNTNGSFLLTADLNEVASVLENLDYDYVDVAFRVGEGEVHRYFNPITGHHNFAGNSVEAMAIAQSGEWVYEGTL